MSVINTNSPAHTHTHTHTHAPKRIKKGAVTNGGRTLYEKALAINQKLFGSTHVYVAQNLNGLGMLHKKMPTGLSFSPFCIFLCFHLRVRSCFLLCLFFCCSSSLFFPTFCFSLYLKSLFCQFSWGFLLSLIISLCLAPSLNRSAGDLDKAIEYHRSALDIFEQKFGREHEKVSALFQSCWVCAS